MKHIFKFVLPVLLLAVFAKCGSNTKPLPVAAPPSQTTGKTFSNPLLYGADPWIIQRDSFYYYTHTLGNRIAIWKTTRVSELGKVTPTEVYRPAPGSVNGANLWAPEIHYLDNKWYIYYTAGLGPDETQRTWVLENSYSDPTTGTWINKGRIFTADTDFWAIDGSVFEYKTDRYFIWSGRPNPAVQNQNIYIAKMANPWTVVAPASLLTKPELNWETRGGAVNEGPEILKNKSGSVFLVYSASGCWTDDYTLGMLRLKENGDPLNAGDWIKSGQPVFEKNPGNSTYGPGHNSFFTSKDGKEDWIIYHANSFSGEGCGDKRNIRIQKFAWSTDGNPQFGLPAKTGTGLTVPSGE